MEITGAAKLVKDGMRHANNATNLDVLIAEMGSGKLILLEQVAYNLGGELNINTD
jgi:hypothetical protein